MSLVSSPSSRRGGPPSPYVSHEEGRAPPSPLLSEAQRSEDVRATYKTLSRMVTVFDLAKKRIQSQWREAHPDGGEISPAELCPLLLGQQQESWQAILRYSGLQREEAIAQVSEKIGARLKEMDSLSSKLLLHLGSSLASGSNSSSFSAQLQQAVESSHRVSNEWRQLENEFLRSLSFPAPHSRSSPAASPFSPQRDDQVVFARPAAPTSSRSRRSLVSASDESETEDSSSSAAAAASKKRRLESERSPAAASFSPLSAARSDSGENNSGGHAIQYNLRHSGRSGHRRGNASDVGQDSLGNLLPISPTFNEGRPQHYLEWYGDKTPTKLNQILLICLNMLKYSGARRIGNRLVDMRYTDDPLRPMKTYYYEPQKSIESFLREDLMDKQRFASVWSQMTDPAFFKKVLVNLENSFKDPEFPYCLPHRSLFAFDIGLFALETIMNGDEVLFEPLRLYKWGDPAIARLEQTNISAANYIPGYVDEDWFNSEEMLAHPERIPTPVLDSMLKHQGYDQLAMRNFYALAVGRMLFPINRLDSFQFAVFLYGAGKCGKSTLIKFIRGFYPDEFTYVFSSNTQAQFSLANAVDAYMVFVCDVKKNFALPQSQFQSMVCGESMEFARKHVQQTLQKEWSAPLMMAGNEWFSYHDTADCINRRVCTFPFPNPVRRQINNLPERLAGQRAAVLLKGVYEYCRLVLQCAQKDIWEPGVLSPLLHRERQRIQKESNPLMAFILSGRLVGPDTSIDATTCTTVICGDQDGNNDDEEEMMEQERERPFHYRRDENDNYLYMPAALFKKAYKEFLIEQGYDLKLSKRIADYEEAHIFSLFGITRQPPPELLPTSNPDAASRALAGPVPLIQMPYPRNRTAPNAIPRLVKTQFIFGCDIVEE